MKKRRERGFIDLRILFFSAIVIALGLAALPNFVKARTTRGRSVCGEYAMWVEAAKQLWAAENKKSGGEAPTDAELAGCMRRVRANPKAEVASRRLPFDANGKLAVPCPVGGYFNLGTMTNRAHCSTTKWNEEYFQERYYNIIAELTRR